VWTRDASGPHRLVSELDIGVFLRRMAERLAGGKEA
jgi:hypothetical protein